MISRDIYENNDRQGQNRSSKDDEPLIRSNSMVQNATNGPQSTDRFGNLVEKFDLFSKPVPSFTVRGKARIASPVGCIASLFVIFTTIILAAATVIDFLAAENQFRTIISTETDYFAGKHEPFRGVQIAFGLIYNEKEQALAENLGAFDEVSKMFDFKLRTREKKDGVLTDTLMAIKRCTRD